MTREKDFKRVVREYASRTGRSYSSARRILLAREGKAEDAGAEVKDAAEAAATSAFKTIARPKLGFTLSVPEAWAEFPALLSNSPYEVARFACRDHTSHLCIVFRMPGSPGLHPRGTAEQAMVRQRSQGFGNFVLRDSPVGKRAGVALTFDRKTEAGTWSAREYFVSAGSLVYCLGLGSGDAEGDASVFDAMAAAFDVSG
jgi:hypothetical protein